LSGRARRPKWGDEKSGRGGQHRSRVAAGEEYEVRDEASEPGISEAELRATIKEAGNDRKKIVAVANGKAG
jgi:hypothetical protein